MTVVKIERSCEQCGYGHVMAYVDKNNNNHQYSQCPKCKHKNKNKKEKIK